MQIFFLTFLVSILVSSSFSPSLVCASGLHYYDLAGVSHLTRIPCQQLHIRVPNYANVTRETPSRLLPRLAININFITIWC